MKQKTQVLILALAAMFALSVLAAETVSVIVKKTSIREDNQFFAPMVAEAEYNDQLLVLETRQDWIKVDRNGTEGWVHLSAISSITAVAPSSKDEVSVDYSSEEIALAGKGFSGQVEEQYREHNPDLNFAAVDEMEKSSVAQLTVIEFQVAGKLTVREIAP